MERIDPRITAAQEHATKVCENALTQTKDDYKPFIVLIQQRKKVAQLSKDTALWAEIKLPYMSVDGRLRIAHDEHRANGATLTIHTSFLAEPGSGQILCRAVVTSSLYGEAMGHARVNIGGPGVDKTNPHENSETSAIGRALGFLGYGLFGTGIASAEEVMQAREQAERPTKPERSMPMMTAPAAPAAPAQTPPDALFGEHPAAVQQLEYVTQLDPAVYGGNPATERQLTYLKSLLERTGTAEADLEAEIVAAAKSSAVATRRIAELQKEIRQSAVGAREEE